MPAFWIDSNVLMESANGAYGFDLAPGFWEFVEEQIHADQFCIPKAVYLEISTKDTDLKDWVDQRPDSAVVEASREVQETYREIADFVANGEYEDHEKRNFLNGADGWLIAHAKIADGTVVTQEKTAGPGARVVKIPNICDRFQTIVIDRDALLRQFGVRLIRE